MKNYLIVASLSLFLIVFSTVIYHLTLKSDINVPSLESYLKIQSINKHSASEENMTLVFLDMSCQNSISILDEWKTKISDYDNNSNQSFHIITFNDKNPYFNELLNEGYFDNLNLYHDHKLEVLSNFDMINSVENPYAFSITVDSNGGIIHKNKTGKVYIPDIAHKQ